LGATRSVRLGEGFVRYVAAVLIVGSAVAFAFLAYTLLNLGRLGIGIMHPRVLVEAGLGIVLLIAGVWLLRT
jgi:hypothetical protein